MNKYDVLAVVNSRISYQGRVSLTHDNGTQPTVVATELANDLESKLLEDAPKVEAVIKFEGKDGYWIPATVEARKFLQLPPVLPTATAYPTPRPPEEVQPDQAIRTLLHLMAQAHAESTAGQWERGETTHHTVVKRDGYTYRIAEFRHSADAYFVDMCKEHLPALIAKIYEMDEQIVQLKIQNFWLREGKKEQGND